jgi:hypothetical protein
VRVLVLVLPVAALLVGAHLALLLLLGDVRLSLPLLLLLLV